MVKENERTCRVCGGTFRKYGTVQRIVRTKRRETYYICLQRLQCRKCHSVHREIPEIIFPFKQYESEMILGVLEGFITPDILGYEDYPCEMTMQRWKTQSLQGLLWR